MTTTYDANSLPEPVRREREKWDAYYEAHPDEPENPVIQASGEELATHMAALLPDGARILEAGSGAGWQSLALARLGRFEVHLMDFSAPALRSARRIFERAGQKAEFHLDDVFRKDQPQYDLVFNAGVLEHYTFEQQAAFLAGMASRSRGYVLALVPNNLCYWYWIWRIKSASQGDWPFGSEVPISDFSRTFQAAGLSFLGGAFLGEAWTEYHIRAIADLPAGFRDELLTIHRSPVVLPEHKAYLYAGLGAVAPALGLPAGSVFRSSPSPARADAPRRQAMFADLLAMQIASRSTQREMPLKFEESAKECAALLERLRAEEQECLQAREDLQRAGQALAQQQQARTQDQQSIQQLQEQLGQARQALQRAGEELAQQQQSRAQADQLLQTVERVRARDQQSIQQLQEQLGQARQAFAEQLVHMTRQAQELERLRPMETRLQQFDAWAEHARDHASRLHQEVADVRVSRRYKLGNILSAMKKRPWHSLGIVLKWSVGDYRRRGLGLTGALEAPDLLQRVQQGLSELACHQAPPSLAASAPLAEPAVACSSPATGAISQPASQRRNQPTVRPIACLGQTFCDGGLERVVIDLCASLGRLGLPTEILVVGRTGRCAAEARALGFNVVELNEDIDNLARRLAERPPRAVIAHHCSWGFEWLHRAGIPVIEVLHNAYYWQAKDRPLAELRRKCVQSYIAVSNFVADFCVAELDISRKSIEVIPNGLNPAGLIRPPLELLCQRRLERLDSPVLIHVANINPQKNHRLAIHAFARLLTDFPNARLVICGASDHHPDLADAVAEQIATLRLDGKVILAGPTDRRRLARLLSEAHIGILPSSFEGFSIVSLEYAYFGLPTLLSMTGAAEEFLGRYGHGLIARSPAIPPQHLSHANVDARCRTDDEGSIEEVRQHMSALLGDYGNWMRKAASVAARCDEYSIDVTAERYRQVIDRCG